jgi:hypothetical protein
VLKRKRIKKYETQQDALLKEERASCDMDPGLYPATLWFRMRTGYTVPPPIAVVPQHFCHDPDFEIAFSLRSK